MSIAPRPHAVCDNLSMNTPSPHQYAQPSRETCEMQDRADALAHARARFSLPENSIYLDGNSLGALPTATPARLAASVQSAWGRDLIRSWNTAGWVNLPTTIGAALAPLIGARADEVLVADSTSVNIFKLLVAVLRVAQPSPSRNVILSERDNFPTDLYIAEGVNAMLGGRYTLKLVEADEVEAALDHTIAAALITQVNYRSGRLHNMAQLNRAAESAHTHIIWDLSHSAGAVPLALHQDGAKFAVGCGYKYLNGGPGAPGYLYVARDWQAALSNPLSGWFGHATPFAFDVGYTPAPDIARFQCGTPSVLACEALAAGIDTFTQISLQDIRMKSLALSDLFWQLMTTHCGEFGFTCITPRSHAHRGSQLAFAHPDAYAIMQAIIDRGVIGDFRQPNLLRFGFTPLYTRFVDCWDAVMIIRDVMQSGDWQSLKYQQRHAVT